MINYFFPLSEFLIGARAGGGIGRHVRLRGVCASVRVQVPPRAPFPTIFNSKVYKEDGLPKAGADAKTNRIADKDFFISDPCRTF